MSFFENADGEGTDSSDLRHHPVLVPDQAFRRGGLQLCRVDTNFNQHSETLVLKYENSCMPCVIATNILGERRRESFRRVRIRRAVDAYAVAKFSVSESNLK